MRLNYKMDKSELRSLLAIPNFSKKILLIPTEFKKMIYTYHFLNLISKN